MTCYTYNPKLCDKCGKPATMFMMADIGPGAAFCQDHTPEALGGPGCNAEEVAALRADLAALRTLAADLVVVLKRVDAQVGNTAPDCQRHILTPELRDDMAALLVRPAVAALLGREGQ